MVSKKKWTLNDLHLLTSWEARSLVFERILRGTVVSGFPLNGERKQWELSARLL